MSESAVLHIDLESEGDRVEVDRFPMSKVILLEAIEGRNNAIVAMTPAEARQIANALLRAAAEAMEVGNA